MLGWTLPLLPSTQELSGMRLLQQSGSAVGNMTVVWRLHARSEKCPRVRLRLPCSGLAQEAIGVVGYKVRVAENADEALERVMDTPIHILILCHTVPFEFAENLLLVARTSQPVVKSRLLAAGKPTLYQHLGNEVHDTADGPAKFLAKVKNIALINIHTN